MKKLEASILRGDVVHGGKRIDGRSTTQVRRTLRNGAVAADPWIFSFTRGETQALVITTLGTGDDEQIIDRCMAIHAATSFFITTSHPIRLVRLAASALPVARGRPW